MIAAGIHQRAGERVAAILDHAGKRVADHLQRMILQRQRKHAGRQPLGAHRDRDFEIAVLAREPGQGAGLGERDFRLVAGRLHRLREQHRAEGAGRQKHDLSVGQMRRQRLGDIGLRMRGRGADDQFGIAHGFGDVVGDQRQLRHALAGKILDQNGRSGGAMRFDRGLVAPPQPRVVSGKREISRGCERAVAATQYCDTHQSSLQSRVPGAARVRRCGCRTEPRSGDGPERWPCITSRLALCACASG